MLTYGPFQTSAAASIGFCSIADRKYGRDIGVAWMEGTTTQLFRPPVTRSDGRTDMLIIEGHGPVRPPVTHPKLAPPPPGAQLAWDGVGVAADAVGVVLAYTAVVGAIALAGSAAAGIGAAALVVFSLIEFADTFAMFMADGVMLVAEIRDRNSKSDRREVALKENPYYKFISTWGPIVAIPSIGRDILQLRRFLSVERDISELSRQVSQRLSELAPKWTIERDAAVLDRMIFLSEAAKQLSEDAADIARELRTLQRLASPADLIGAANTVLHFGDIADGVESSFGSWMNELDGWVQPNAWFEAHPGAAFPYNAHDVAFRQAMGRYQTERVQASTYYVTMHIITGGQVRRR